MDGSDSNPTVCAWAGFPSFYYLKDSIFRYMTQGVGQCCHDVHDNIFEYFYNPILATHGNILECNDNSPGDAPNHPRLRQMCSTTIFSAMMIPASAQPGKSIGGSAPKPCRSSISITSCTTWQTRIGGTSPVLPATVARIPAHKRCSIIRWLMGSSPAILGGSNNTGGIYLTVLNEHLINTPYDASGCTGYGDATNVAQTSAQAVSQGYTIAGGNSGVGHTCANDTTPCAPTSPGNATVGTGANHQAYCTTLAGYTSEYQIGTEAANACQYDTTDGCSYDSTTHVMNCPAQTAVARPASGAWDVGAYQFTGASTLPAPANPMLLTGNRMP